MNALLFDTICIFQYIIIAMIVQTLDSKKKALFFLKQ